MYNLRLYNAEDEEQIIKLFLLNTPEYFCAEEQADLEYYLQKEIEQYYVVENEGGEIIACGGYNIKGDVGCLSWYIVHPDYQGKGAGGMIVRQSLDELKRNNGINEIIVRTSQLVYPFYEKFGFETQYTEDNYWGAGMHLYYMKLK